MWMGGRNRGKHPADTTEQEPPQEGYVVTDMADQVAVTALLGLALCIALAWVCGPRRATR